MIAESFSIYLDSVYNWPSESAQKLLWQLLEERDPHVNISHKEMPSWKDHLVFVNSRPYRNWLFVFDTTSGKDPVGTVYLSKQNEIGIHLFKEHQGKGIGPVVLDIMMKIYPNERLLANIAPTNPRSQKMFEEAGFKLIQHTYEIYT